MKTKTYAVIGAQYGDEGKGLITDFLVSRLIAGGYQPTVVRSNGGAQAAHTVVDGGRRHVFHHFGSGTFLGASTHLSSYFVVNPIMFNREYVELGSRFLIEPDVTVDPCALVTLPCDMMINQIVETVRGTSRHGSCGLGVGETIERSQSRDGFCIMAGDIFARSDALDDLGTKSRKWIEHRLAQLGIDTVPDEYAAAIKDDAIIDAFLSDCTNFRTRTRSHHDFDLAHHGALVFEGAQGLALDQNHVNFPHVTRSYTGLTNVVHLCNEACRTELSVVYVTRCYTTRHGAGPLAHEGDISTEINVDDPTNVPNEWQGSLRFAPLDLEVLKRNIEHDLEQANALCEDLVFITPAIAVTCIDQIRDEVTFRIHGGTIKTDADGVADVVTDYLDIPVALQSRGSTRDDVKVTEYVS